MSLGGNFGNGKNRLLQRWRNNDPDDFSHSDDANDSGFGSSFTSPDIRLMNRDGTLNVAVRGVERYKRFNLYKQLVKLPSYQFYIAILFLYIFLNAAFGLVYYLIGLEGLTTGKEELHWWDAFFFSTQTFTTVGFGHISPQSFMANLVASTEAFVGLLFFAIATGLVYGRFSTSRADVRFSKNMLMNNSNEHQYLMVRIANVSSTELSDLEAQIIMSYIEEGANGRNIRRYRNLKLELPRINLLTTSWTIVHKITETSPCQLLNLDKPVMGLEFMLFLTAFDEIFDQKIKVRTSYLEKDIIRGAKFDPITSHSRMSTVVDLDLLSSFHSQEEDSSL